MRLLHNCDWSYFLWELWRKRWKSIKDGMTEMIIGNFGAAVNSQDRMPPICPTAWSAPLWTFLASTDKKNWQQKTNILSPSKSFSIIHFEPFHPDISYLSVFIHSIHFHPTLTTFIQCHQLLPILSTFIQLYPFHIFPSIFIHLYFHPNHPQPLWRSWITGYMTW